MSQVTWLCVALSSHWPHWSVQRPLPSRGKETAREPHEGECGGPWVSVQQIGHTVCVCARVCTHVICLSVWRTRECLTYFQQHPAAPRSPPYTRAHSSSQPVGESLCFSSCVPFLTPPPRCLCALLSVFPSVLLSPPFLSSLLSLCCLLFPFFLHSPSPELSLWEVFQEFAFVLQL